MEETNLGIHGNDIVLPDDQRLIQTYLSGLQVEAGLCGFNTVGSDWRDENYTPSYSKYYFIRSGRGTLKVGSRVFHPGVGQIALMPEGTLQSYGPGDGPPYTKHWCHFNARVGRISLFDLLDLPLVIDVPGDQIPTLERWFTQLIENDHVPQPWSVLEQKGAILGLTSWYLAHSTPLVPARDTGRPEVRLQSCLNHIEEHLPEPMTLDTLAETVHLEPAYFSRLFHKHFGVPPMRYLQSRRLEEAKRLLGIPTLTLADIGSRVGIENPFYLSRLFKTQLGFSPTEYRALISSTMKSC